MSLTPTAPTMTEPRSAPAKVAVAAAILFAASLFLTVASVNVPHEATDRELLDWWQQTGNRTSGVVSGLFAVCAAAMFAVFMSQVHELEATRRSPTLRSLARAMAGAFIATMLVVAATRSAIGHLVDVMNEPLPSVDVLRYATALNYQVFGLAAMGALSLTILATSALALRTSAFSRWAGAVGIACGGVMLIAVGAGYGGYTVPLAMLWSVTMGIAVRPQSSSRTTHSL
jgi:uncharacterized paraquat-inducible protein A